jgi:hypothetical protein
MRKREGRRQRTRWAWEQLKKIAQYKSDGILTLTEWTTVSTARGLLDGPWPPVLFFAAGPDGFSYAVSSSPAMASFLRGWMRSWIPLASEEVKM